jgi:hypothetical protein
MSTTAITMEELESEHAELLPSRETLHCCYGAKTAYGSSSNTNSFVYQSGQGNINGSHNFTVELNNANSGFQLIGL